MPRGVLLSLHPTYARAIYEGVKGYEFRRVRMHVRPGDRVIVYETAPVGLATGEFTVGEVHAGSPEGLLGIAGRQAGPGAEEYLSGATTATALEVLAPCRWDEPLPLSAAGLGGRPPLSYRFLGRRAAARSARRDSSSATLAK